MNDTDRAYSVLEIAERTGLNPETIRRWVRAGDVQVEPTKTLKMGNLIRKSEILRHVEATHRSIEWRDD